jgi:hypothetical protein
MSISLRDIIASSRPFASPLLPPEYYLYGDLFAVIRKSKICKKIDEKAGNVDMPAVFACGIVMWKRMVIVMKTLTHSTERHYPILSRIDLGVIRSVPPHVRGAVDQPGSVEIQTVAENDGYKVCVPQRLDPKVVRNDAR